MRRVAFLLAAGVLAAACGDPGTDRENIATSPALELDEDHGGAVVRVAAPTGNPAVDVPNIEASVAAARPGGTILFGRGTYAIEEATHIVVSVPRVTLQGHQRGTTIRGVTSFASPDFLVGHFLLNGGRQTVRGLTFEGFATALSFGEPAPAPRTGGYRLENSVFRNGDVAFESVTFSNDVSTVRGNKFINVTLPFAILGKTFHVLDNRNTNPDPAATPPGRPFNAGVVIPEFWSLITSDGAIPTFPCEKNLIEGNTVVANADGFILLAFGEDKCRKNVIRRNTLIGQRVFINPDGSTGDNATMAVLGGPGVEENLIEENVLRGSEGLGIIVDEGSRNRIVGNRFFDLPGVRPTATPFPGTAIFLGEPTTRNRVCENEFKRVVNKIVDLGTDNIICRGQDDDEDGDDDDRVSALRLQGAGARLRTLDHPKLRVLRDRMKE